MAAKPRVLLTFFEGLTETVIDSQVLEHVRLMQAADIADFEIWALPWDPKVRELSLARLADAEHRAGCPISVFPGIRPGKAGSVLANGSILAKAAKARGTQFDIVHARTDYATLVAAPFARDHGAALLFDCRGDSAAELDYRRDLNHWPRRLLKPLLRHALTRRLHMAARLCDRALFVSRPLYHLVAGEICNKPHAVIPCCAAEDNFFFDPALRRAARARLGYGVDEIVYIYSGGLQPYQRFDDTIAAFSRLRARVASVRLLIATPQAEVARQRLSTLPAGSWQVVSARLEDVNSLLNAADAAFLLRYVDGTNRVASPTKFAEYCLTGLPVIMTEAIIDSHRLAMENGNFIRFDDIRPALTLPPQLDRSGLAQRYRGLLGKRAFFDTYRRIYTPD